MMNWYDRVVLTILYGVICAGQAFYQAHQFDKQRGISHFWHGVYYAMACIIISLAYWNVLSFWDGVVVGVYGGIFRLAFFDTILNSIRGKELWYNGEDDGRLTRNESLQDWWENKVWRFNEPGGKRRLLMLRIGYLCIWLIYVILIF